MSIQLALDELKSVLERLKQKSGVMQKLHAAWEVEVVKSKISLVFLALDAKRQTSPDNIHAYLEQLDKMPLGHVRALFIFDEDANTLNLDDEKQAGFLREIMHALTTSTVSSTQQSLREANLNFDELIYKYSPKESGESSETFRKKGVLRHECFMLLLTCFSSLRKELAPEHYQKISSLDKKINTALEPFIQDAVEKLDISDAAEALSSFKLVYDEIVEEGQHAFDVEPGIWEKYIQPVLDKLYGALIKVVARLPVVDMVWPSLSEYGDSFFKPKQTKDEAVSIWDKHTQYTAGKIHNIFQPG